MAVTYPDLSSGSSGTCSQRISFDRKCGRDVLGAKCGRDVLGVSLLMTSCGLGDGPVLGVASTMYALFRTILACVQGRFIFGRVG